MKRRTGNARSPARGATSSVLAINNARSGRLVSAGAHGRVVGGDVVYVAHRYVGRDARWEHVRDGRPLFNPIIMSSLGVLVMFHIYGPPVILFTTYTWNATLGI